MRAMDLHPVGLAVDAPQRHPSYPLYFLPSSAGEGPRRPRISRRWQDGQGPRDKGSLDIERNKQFKVPSQVESVVACRSGKVCRIIQQREALNLRSDKARLHVRVVTRHGRIEAPGRLRWFRGTNGRFPDWFAVERLLGLVALAATESR